MSEESKSRVENILNSILGTIDPSELLPAQSRVEAILIALDAKIQELSELSGKIPIHICTSGEYNQLTGIPTIENPETDIFYLVPDGSGNNIYTEWIYTGDRWEYFSGQDQKIPSEIPAEVSSALLNIFRHVAYTDNQGATLITNLERALYGIKPVRLEAVYNPPAGYVIYTDDDLDKVAAYLTVTEYYSDGSSVVVTDYTLSGTLVDGTSTLTVEYDELTTTVQVEAGPDWYDKWAWEQSAGDIAVRNNTVGFLENIGNNIYIDQRADRENNRRSVQTTHGTVPFVLYNSVDGGVLTPVELYPIPVPPRAICVQMSCDTQDIQWGLLVLRLESGKYLEVEHSTSYTVLGKKQWLITGENHFIAPYILRSDRGDFTEELENVRFTFTRNGQWRWTLTDSDLVMHSRSIAWDSANSRITYSASGVSNYKGVMVPDGLCGYYTNGALTTGAPIPVPPTATKVTVTTTPALQAQMILLRAADDQTQQLISDNGWKDTPAAMTFEAGDNLEVAVQLRVNASAQNFTTATTPTEIVIEFEEV